MRINVGSVIRWVSAGGVLTGTVKSIKLDLNAAGTTIPWLIIQDIVGENGRQRSGVCMPGTDSYFSMMKLEVLE